MPISKEEFNKGTGQIKAEVVDQNLSEWILVDTREKSNLAGILKDLGYRVAEGPLAIGDLKYKDIVVERKTIGDFVSSMLSGRLDMQFNELAYIPLPFLAVVGSIEEWEKNMEDREILLKFNPDAIYGMIASTIIRYGIGVWWVPTDYALAKIFGKVCKKYEQGKIGVPHRLRVPYKGRDKRIDLLAVILGITRTQTHNLLKRFENPLQLLQMSEGDLQRVPGVGSITAKKIRAFCDEPLKE